MTFFHRHNWSKWSEPKEHEYYQHPNPVYQTPGGTVQGFIQERTCESCGKYQWRKV